MTRKGELLIIGVASLAIASGASHLAARAIQFRTEAVQPMTFGAGQGPVGGTTGGSSLTYYGINWSEISKALGERIRGWAVPGGSVEEMEMLQRSAPPASYTFLGVSANDLNANYISEFHANVVSFGETLGSLYSSGAGWALGKRVLAQYPLKYLRVLFPTAGRSTHVMVGLRGALRALRPHAAAETSERAVVTSDSNLHQESMGEWPAARRLRQLGDAKSSAAGTFEFRGPKRDALFRYVRRGAAQGKMIVVVLPEAPIFRQELVTAAQLSQFEAVLAEARERTPEALWVRLDTEPALQSEAFYWDLVHMNAPGQAMATELLLAKLRAAGVVK
jgi:hypothetical protein